MYSQAMFGRVRRLDVSQVRAVIHQAWPEDDGHLPTPGAKNPRAGCGGGLGGCSGWLGLQHVGACIVLGGFDGGRVQILWIAPGV